MKMKFSQLAAIGLFVASAGTGAAALAQGGDLSLLEELRVHPKSTAEAVTLAIRVLQAIAAIVSITTNLRDFL